MLVKNPSSALQAWPPEEYQKRHKVAQGDNWWTLAKQYGRQDPWDIIQFNFRTKTPEEVNYYLANLVGCTKSNDGKNYSFSGSDSPGFVYIPRPEWDPIYNPGTLKDIVVGILEAWVGRIPYVDALRLAAIVKAKIKVVEDRRLSTPWEYDFADTLYVRPQKFGYDTDWLVKEAFLMYRGPHGWSHSSYSDVLEAAGWVATAGAWAKMKAMNPSNKFPFSYLQARRGYWEKTAIFQEALKYWKANQGKAHPGSMEAVKAAVRLDPDYNRRMAGPWKREE